MGVDMFSITMNIFRPFLHFLKNLFFMVFGGAFSLVFLFFALFFIIHQVNPFRLWPAQLEFMKVKFKYYDLLRWLLWDFSTRKERKGIFKPYGFSIFVGKQGGGKTVSMVNYLEMMKQKYPGCIIVTNFACDFADKRMEDWRDLFEIRNGESGVIFAIDEIHSEYNAASWATFPETLLSQISQQRKQKVKIIASAQVYSRVVKQIREQTFSVICCSTFLGRLTICKEYDAAEYSTADTPYQVKKKCKPISRSCFVQSNHLRRSYDTYEVVERLSRTDFIPRDKRSSR